MRAFTLRAAIVLAFLLPTATPAQDFEVVTFYRADAGTDPNFRSAATFSGVVHPTIRSEFLPERIVNNPDSYSVDRPLGCAQTVDYVMAFGVTPFTLYVTSRECLETIIRPAMDAAGIELIEGYPPGAAGE